MEDFAFQSMFLSFLSFFQFFHFFHFFHFFIFFNFSFSFIFFHFLSFSFIFFHFLSFSFIFFHFRSHNGAELCNPGAESPGSETPGDSGTPWSPRALTVVSTRKLEKLALNSGTTGGARKMTRNASKRPIIAATVRSSTCLCCELECPPKIRDVLNLRHFHCLARSHGRSQPSMNCTELRRP